MSLESHLPERLNVRRLTTDRQVESESLNLEFDPKKDISDVEWFVMKKMLAAERGEISPFISFADRFLKLFPERREELGIDDSEIYSKIVREVEASATRNINDFLELATDFKNLYPNAALNEPTDETWERMKGLQKDTFDLYNYVQMKIIDPKRFDKPEFDDELLQVVKRRLKYLATTSDFADRVDYASMAAEMKILFPAMKSSELYLDKGQWEFINEELRRRKEYMRLHLDMNSIDALAQYYHFAHILAAERVEVNEHGLHIIMPEEKKSLAPAIPVPEQRKF